MTKIEKHLDVVLTLPQLHLNPSFCLEGGLKKLALSTRKISIFHTLALYLKGSLLKGPGTHRDLFGVLGPYLYFRFPIFSVWASFTLRMSIQSACIVTTMS